jgi:hypothetical protein
MGDVLDEVCDADDGVRLVRERLEIFNQHSQVLRGIL